MTLKMSNRFDFQKRKKDTLKKDLTKLLCLYGCVFALTMISLALLVKPESVINNQNSKLANYPHTDYPSLNSVIDAKRYRGKAIDPTSGIVYQVDNDGTQTYLKPAVDKHKRPIQVKPIKKLSRKKAKK